MKNQTDIAKETAATLDVTTQTEAARLDEMVSNLWRQADASWRNGDTRYTRDIVNSLASLARATGEKLRELTPHIPDEIDAILNA